MITRTNSPGFLYGFIGWFQIGQQAIDLIRMTTAQICTYTFGLCRNEPGEEFL